MPAVTSSNASWSRRGGTTHPARIAFARQLAILNQGADAPAGTVVEDIVTAGRFPYQRWYRQWSREDERAVEHAMTATGVTGLRRQPLETLSGGQRQRVWLAMVLAQETPVLLLDEPTTFLDIAYQYEVLDLIWDLNRTEGRTVVVVLHDLGQACRYADYLIAMRRGAIAAAGTPREFMTPALMREVFKLDCCIVPDPLTGTPLVLANWSAGAGGGPDRPETAHLKGTSVGAHA